MHIALFVSVAAVCGGLCGSGANAAPIAGRIGASPSSVIVRIADGGGRGYRWVPPGYAKHRRYRPGHCAPR